MSDYNDFVPKTRGTGDIGVSYDLSAALAEAVPANRLVAAAGSGRTATVTKASGQPPSFVITDEGRVVVSHDCLSGRLSCEVDTISGYGWQVLFVDSEMLTLSKPVVCTRCNKLTESVFTKDHLYRCGECGEPHSQITHCPFCGSEDVM